MMISDRFLHPISIAELERRWAILRKLMQAENLDALVFQSNNDWLGGYVKWLTDIPAQNGYPRSVVFYQDAPMTVVEMGAFEFRRILAADEPIHRGVDELIGVPSFLSVNYTTSYEGGLVAAELRRHGVRNVGLVGEGGMAHGFVRALRDITKDVVRFHDLTDAVDKVKAVKSREEQVMIRAAAALQDDVFAQVLKQIRPGLRDTDLAALAQNVGRQGDSEQGIILGASAPIGMRSVFMGSHLQGRILEKNDHISMLIEINGPGGFYTEIARTIVLGRASNELLEGFEAVKQAQAYTLSLIRPGASCSSIFEAHNHYMRSNGLPPEARLYAHGQGYDMVERPLIRQDETMSMAEGMCLAVHPGYETRSMFAVICDNYFVTETGVSDCLHKTEKKVFEVL